VYVQALRGKDIPLDGNVYLTEISKDKVDHLLVLVLSNVLDERSRVELLSELPSSQSVLGEAVIPVVGDCLISSAGDMS
jgi:hypothetical protein